MVLKQWSPVCILETYRTSKFAFIFQDKFSGCGCGVCVPFLFLQSRGLFLKGSLALELSQEVVCPWVCPPPPPVSVHLEQSLLSLDT